MLKKVKIYQIPKTSTQSGKYKSRLWVLEALDPTLQQEDAIMEWTGGGRTTRQIHLTFSSLEEALAYARSQQYQVEVLHSPLPRKLTIRPYQRNFE